MEVILMILAILAGSAISLAGGALIFTTKKRRDRALLIAMPFGAGALLAAAFFDLLPEAFEQAPVDETLIWVLVGFLAFFLFERSASWFHAHHEHDHRGKDSAQRKLIILGDLVHNAIDGVAIGAAFVVNPALGIITTIAVSAHEIPKELGTFALLLSRGWKDKTVLLANIATAVATIVTAVLVFSLGGADQFPVAAILAATAGFFIYIAASDIIPEIHEQSHRPGMIQAGMLVIGVVLVGSLITVLHSSELHGHDHEPSHSHIEEHHDEHDDEH